MSNPDFSAYYLQRITQEVAEDVERLRRAGDFKPEHVALLVGALQQGDTTFTARQQARIVASMATSTTSPQTQEQTDGNTSTTSA